MKDKRFVKIAKKIGSEKNLSDPTILEKLNEAELRFLLIISDQREQILKILAKKTI